MSNENNKSLWQKIRKLIKNKIKQDKEQSEIKEIIPFYMKLQIGLSIILFIFACIFFEYGYDCITTLSNFKFNSCVAKYHMTDTCLDISNQYSKIIKRNSDISYFFRHRLMDMYIIAKETFGKDFYNSSGLFFSICRDYKLVQSIHTKNKENLTKNEIERFLNYEQQFLTELHVLLMEY